MGVSVGIDIGGTGTKLGIVDDDGNILAKKEFGTWDFKVFEDFVDELTKLTTSMLIDVGKSSDLQGIGIGSPMGKYVDGTIDHASNLPWKGLLPIVSLLKNHFDAPIIITNDANTAALGEKVFGGAKDFSDFVMVTLGTGLGSGFISNGQLVLGVQGFAGELGHVNIGRLEGRTCGCGKKECLETYVSATGIKRTIFSLMAKRSIDSEFRHVSFDDLSTKDITIAADKGDKIALEAFQFTGKILGRKLAEVVMLFNPEAIFLAGGLSLAGDYIIKPTRKFMEKDILDVYREKVQFRSSELGSEGASILGAASLVKGRIAN
jgi:glucokinase